MDAGRQITDAEVRSALRAWQEFWPAPRHLTTEAAATAFVRHYREAVNAERLVAVNWDRVVVRIKSRCGWFPYPKDLLETAQAIAEERRA